MFNNLNIFAWKRASEREKRRNSSGKLKHFAHKEIAKTTQSIAF